MRILVVGDVVGNPGRKTLKAFLDKNKSDYDFIIVNGENAAAGFGITTKLCDEILSWGVNVITSGNHIWDKKEIYDYLDGSDRVLRPYNYPQGVPGFGYTVQKDRKGNKIGVISLQGRVFMPPIDCPFTTLNSLLDELRKECKHIIVDFHAEATSEKLALANYVDGKVSVVYGTHTHIQTADNKVLSEGTGYISDVGMTGSDNGIIGMKKESIIPKFLTSLPQRFEIAEGKERINGIDIELDDETGECTKIDRINLSLIELGIF
nr:TIGR00282 family metallophosphoesterase [uncultured Cetobacterium sp.]